MRGVAKGGLRGRGRGAEGQWWNLGIRARVTDCGNVILLYEERLSAVKSQYPAT